jgi:hypothetical protein
MGLFTPLVFYTLGLHLVMVVIAFSFLDGIWDMKHVFPRMALLFLLLALPLTWNFFSLDHVLGFN